MLHIAKLCGDEMFGPRTRIRTMKESAAGSYVIGQDLNLISLVNSKSWLFMEESKAISVQMRDEHVG